MITLHDAILLWFFLQNDIIKLKNTFRWLGIEIIVLVCCSPLFETETDKEICQWWVLLNRFALKWIIHMSIECDLKAFVFCHDHLPH